MRKKLFLALVFFLFFFLTEVLLVGFVLARTKAIGRSGRFNLLILGGGGANHEALDLTDTIMVVLANRQRRKLLLVSLPRDIWIPSLQTKINSLYHYGGFSLVNEEVEKIIGQPIDKNLLVGFQSFEKMIDALGGVEVKVERSFDDFYYPVPGREDDLCGGDPQLSCRYEHLHFEAGWQKMDGARALKFVRSRHAEGEEGTDFARNARQQKVILALKDKIFSSAVWWPPQRLLALARTVKEEIQTDITSRDYLPLLKFFLPFVKGSQLESLVLNGGRVDSEGFLDHPRSHPSGQWVLVPKEGSWEKVQEYINQKL